MTINKILPEVSTILKDDNQLWYFTKDQKNTIINYLKDCSIEDLQDVSAMSEIYYIPTWYYLLNDYDIAKKLIQKENFKELLFKSEKDYKIPQSNKNQKNKLNNAFKRVVTHLDTTLYFTPNNEVLLLLKHAGFQFKDNSFSTDSLYRTYEIMKAGVIDFDEDYLIKNNYTFEDSFTSILQKILFNYENKKSVEKDLLEMAKTINGFVQLGCNTNIEYKKLITAGEVFISSKKNYRTLIKEHCPQLHIYMERLDLVKKMHKLPSKKESKTKI